MKLYRIVRRDDLWHVYCGEPEHSVAALEEKDDLIALARQLARKHEGEMHVYDADGNLEAVHTFRAGRESSCRPPKLRIVGPATG